MIDAKTHPLRTHSTKPRDRSTLNRRDRSTHIEEIEAHTHTEAHTPRDRSTLNLEIEAH